MSEPPLRLTLDSAALVANWRWLRAEGGQAACGAAVKAEGYGLGARAVVDRLAAAGCRDFYVATWDEADALGDLPEGSTLSVLHGVRETDMARALQHRARPVLNSPVQVTRWKAAGGGACDVMVDTGMNRLGLTIEEARSGLLDKLKIATLMSHLACAEEADHGLNMQQLYAFRLAKGFVKAKRYSLANSAGICLGPRYAFDLTRPGLALYGGVPTPAAAGHIKPVVGVEAQLIQRRTVRAGQTVGYGATFTAPAEMQVGILNLGYADGYLRAFAAKGYARAGGVRCPLVGRVSMDLIAVDLGQAGAGEGDWLEIGYDLAETSAVTGLSQYELLTGLGHRYQRRWT